MDHAAGDFAAGMPLRVDPPKDAEHVVLIAGQAVALADGFGDLIQVVRRDHQADHRLVGHAPECPSLLDPLSNRHGTEYVFITRFVKGRRQRGSKSASARWLSRRVV